MASGCPQAVKENPRDAELFARRAAAHLKLKEYIEAANDASKSIELDPQASRGYLMKGCTFTDQRPHATLAPIPSLARHGCRESVILTRTDCMTFGVRAGRQPSSWTSLRLPGTPSNPPSKRALQQQSANCGCRNVRRSWTVSCHPVAADSLHTVTLPM